MIAIGTFLAIARVQLEETRRKLIAAETMCGHLRNSKKGMIYGWPVDGYSVRVNDMESPLYKVASPLFAQFDPTQAVEANSYQIIKGGEVIHADSMNQVALLAGDRLNLTLDLKCLQELKS
jgi:hypothetical protein